MALENGKRVVGVDGVVAMVIPKGGSVAAAVIVCLMRPRRRVGLDKAVKELVNPIRAKYCRSPVKKRETTKALGFLAEQSLITNDDPAVCSLTSLGQEVAKKLFPVHASLPNNN